MVETQVTRRQVLCVDIGGTSTKVALLSPSGELSEIDSILTTRDSDSFLATLYSLIERRLDTSATATLGIGVALAGFLDDERTRLIYNPNISWLEQIPLKQLLAKRFALPVELESDSNASCMAEFWFGRNAGPKRFLCITAGTGLGVGMSVNGRPLRFAYGCMGDAGHIIVEADGPRCSCGGRGCAEAVVSARALAEEYRLADETATSASLRQVIEAANNGAPLAIAILNRAGRALGIVSASLANTFFPDEIALAGGLSAAGSFVMKPADEAFRDHSSAKASNGVPFSKARLGPRASLIGAAWPFWTDRRSPDASETDNSYEQRRIEL